MSPKKPYGLRNVKMFGIGLNKTGGATLGECSKIPGYRCKKNMTDRHIRPVSGHAPTDFFGICLVRINNLIDTTDHLQLTLLDPHRTITYTFHNIPVM